MKVHSLKHLFRGSLGKALRVKRHLLMGLTPVALLIIGVTMNYATSAGAAPGPDNKKGNTPPAPVTAPVLEVNVNDPGRIPYQAMNTLLDPLDNHQFGCVFRTVPTGYRLVVQNVSGQISFNPATAVTVMLSNLVAYTQLRSIFPVQNTQAFNQPVLAYYDAGENPLVIITTASDNNYQPTSFGGLTMTGYLVDCNAGPCAAIAN